MASGEVTVTNANVWTRADQPATLAVEYDTVPEFQQPTTGETVRVSAETDFTGVAALTGLRPATRYFYRVREANGASPSGISGSFVTAPLSDQPSSVTFLWGGDLGGQGVCRRSTYVIFDAMRVQAADFFLFGGDTVYADGRCPSPPNAPGADFRATSQEQFWAKYKYQREDAAFQRFLARTSVYAIWDDHEVKSDFSGSVEPLMPIGLKAFWEYFPFTPREQGDRQLYRSFRWGKHLELFILDTRQYRSPNLQPDGPDKTMLGAAQLQWLLDGLASSTATWQVIFSSVPLSTQTGNPTKGHDSWANGSFPGGFGVELAKIVSALRQQQKRNVVWLAADIHVARALAYDPDQDGGVDFHEFISGPLSAATGDLDPLDGAFHPRLLYEETTFLNFGKIRIDGASGTLTVEIIDQEGKAHYTLTLSARL